ncbi:Hsp20 family protein [Leptospira interrogans]
MAQEIKTNDTGAMPMQRYVDADKVKAAFGRGVLKVTLPKRPEAMKAEKRISIDKG